MHGNFEVVKIKKIIKKPSILCEMANKDCKQSTEAINSKPTAGTAPGSQLSGEVS